MVRARTVNEGLVSRHGASSRFLVRLARAIKGDPAFDIDPSIKTWSLIVFAVRRSMMALRGLVLSVRCAGCAFPVFVGRRVTVTNARWLRLSPGVTIGDGCHLDCLGSIGIVLGRGVTLRPGVRIEVTSVLRELGEGIEIGDRVGVSEDCFLGAKGRIVIGNDSMLGPSTKLIAENHSFERTDIPIREQGETRKGIVIGADCWLGANVVILDGVCVGDHSIVAAGAVVTEDVESLTVVGGVPARTLRRRS